MYFISRPSFHAAEIELEGVNRIKEAEREKSHEQIADIATRGAKAIQTQYSILEPSELTETHWQHILANNRALYGFHLDTDSKRVNKARKPGESRNSSCFCLRLSLFFSNHR